MSLWPHNVWRLAGQASLSRSREQLGALEVRAAQQQEQQRQLTTQLSSQQARLNEARDEVSSETSGRF